MLDELDRANTGPTSERIWAATTGWHTIGHRIRTVAEVDIGLPDVVEHLVPLAGRDVRRAVLGNKTPPKHNNRPPSWTNKAGKYAYQHEGS